MTPKQETRKGLSVKDARGAGQRRRRHWRLFRPHREAQHGPSLSAAAIGESVQIQRMDGGHQFLSRLASLGFTPGARLKVVQNYGHGPIIVRLRDTRVALGRGEASKILVQEVAEDDDGR